MSNTGKQSPLGVNFGSGLLQNTGLTINPVAAKYMGSSKTNSDYTLGSICNDTALRLLTYAIYQGYAGYSASTTLSSTTYNNLISIGSTTVPALGNAKPPTYVVTDPTNTWSGQATSGYGLSGDTGQGQSATWIPYDTTNNNHSVTQWGYIRLHALQAWNEFNWNGASPSQSTPAYKEFTSSLLTVKSFTDYTNVGINSFKNAPTFLEGVYSNMNDLTTADITNVTLAVKPFGQDCIAAGKVIDFSKISLFGLPSILLQTLKSQNALTSSLSLALLASGLTPSEIDDIATGAVTTTVMQEQQVYSAFLVIVDVDLASILRSVNCKTQGITTLADLLNIRKLFPNSYASLTVPVYNTSAMPTNSKTYYPIFENGGVSARLTSPAIKAQIGIIIPPNAPIPGSVDINADIQELHTGFGSYLTAILPADIAVTAGAFSTAMQQVKNLQFTTFEKFAQVAASLETTTGLTLVNGSNVPVDVASANTGANLLALGSGPKGTYTASDFFGCMSGLPYLWNDIYKGLLTTQTTKLKNIYQELYLATTWEGAQVGVTYTTNAGPTYTLTGITITDSGGGYGRGTAPAPTIVVANSGGATITMIIGTDPTNITTFGRVTGATVTGATATLSPPSVTSIEFPPTATLAVTNSGVATGGTNTASGTTGWASPMNAVVQAYIDQANAEILSIQTTKSSACKDLNIAYNAAGSQLMREQRSRYIGLSPVPVPADTRMNAYPTALLIFTDAVPELAKQTEPHMYAQTLEAIADRNTVAGQSSIAQMREARNEARLQTIGIGLDNNIPGDLEGDSIVLTSNGTIADSNGINGYTFPASLIVQNPDGTLIAPNPIGYFSLGTDEVTVTDTGYIGQAGYLAASCMTPINEVSPLIEILSASPDDPNAVVRAGVRIPCSNGSPIVNGDPLPGSLNGTPNIVPPNLDGNYISATMTPGSYTVADAIAEVITCNCDCWVD